MQKKNIILLAKVALACLMFNLPMAAQTPPSSVGKKLDGLQVGFDQPQDSARTKVWWFFGEAETTREGITADLEAFKQQGVGGVVYYDQVHGKGEGADKVFDAHWWQSLIFASQEAKRLGLSFEANIGNGYVAGGKWITPDCSMQRLAMSEQVVNSVGKTLTFRMGLPRRPHNWHHEVAVLAVPYKKTLLANSTLLNVVPEGSPEAVQTFDFGEPFTARSITYEATPKGKARTSSMQVPPFSPRVGEMKKGETTAWRFFGCGFRELADIGVLEVSDDGVGYRKVCDLHPKYQNLGGVRQQTVAFPPVTGRFFRIRVTSEEKVKIENAVLSARAAIDEWEEKASLVSELIEADNTPMYNNDETIQADEIVDLTDKMDADGTVTWPNAPKGDWLVMRFVSVTTGGHTKHGRAEALGLECDKLSTRGAHLHWKSYTKPVIDSIRAHGGALEGICMDSHEAGPQNWTVGFEREFHHLRGYDMKKYLPVMAGLVVGTAEESAKFLYDLRHTINDLITDRYFGEFNRLCRAENLTLTAQAIGGALCMAGDAIGVKRLVDKPQAEFWGYQTEGNYDIKDCSSAAHLYGKQIASGEAYTDITYKQTLADIKNLADYAFAFGINELVVCAVAYQPWLDHRLNTANGRQYVLNRHNTFWPHSRPFWDYQARCSWMLRQGKPVSDVCWYLGDEIPARILAHKLPSLPQGYDFDAFTADALLNRMSVSDGRIVLPDGVNYSVMILPADDKQTSDCRQQIEAFRQQGALIYDPKTDSMSLAEYLSAAGIMPDVEAPSARNLYFCHRRTTESDIYFLNNHSDSTLTDCFSFKVEAGAAELWHPVTGQRKPLAVSPGQGRTVVNLKMAPRESYFVVFPRNGSNSQLMAFKNMVQDTQPDTRLSMTSPWTVSFDTRMGGPESPVVFERLNDWTKHADQRIKYFSGTAIAKSVFNIKKKGKRQQYLLNIPLLNTTAEVFINGCSAGTLWCSPYQLDITSLVHKGENQIELRLCNSLWNRLVGDACLPEPERVYWQTHPLANPSDRLVPSGLASEVTIDEISSK